VSSRGAPRKDATRGKLRVHRETLRRLSDAGLARVAGGTLIGLPDDFLRFSVVGGDDQPLPRSNGWTGEGIAVPTC
jgi:hypothetical protein